MVMASANRAELEALEATLYQFRVNELHILLSTFKCPKLGKKIELVQRCIALLQNARNQTAVMQKIREISWSRRYAARPSSPPYNGGTSHHHSSMVMNQLTGAPTVHHQPLTTPAMLQQPYIGGSHTPFSSHIDRARNLRITDLPFYDRQQTLLDLTELPGNISGIRSSARMNFHFSVPQDMIPRISYRSESAPLPRMEVQMRFFLLDHSIEQPDDFPPNCAVKINDIMVALPNVIPTNKPNAEPKRPSRPVNITPYCQSHRDLLRDYRLLVEWTADKRAWAVAVFLVNRLTSEILLRRLLMNVNAHRPADDTKRVIRSRLSGNEDDGIQMESLKISLLCPLGKTRMSIPVKAFDCSHLQCFDLSNFLMMNEKRPTWKCGVCSNTAPYKKLIIDGYFEKVLKEVSGDATEIELLPDGDWCVVSEESEQDSDENDVPELPSTDVLLNNGMSGSNGAPSTSHCNDDDVIVLDSDDEIETQAASILATRQAISRKSAGSDSIYMNREGSHGTASGSVTSYNSSSSVSMSREDNDQSVICIDLDELSPPNVPITSPASYCASSIAIPSMSQHSTPSEPILPQIAQPLPQVPNVTPLSRYFNPNATSIASSTSISISAGTGNYFSPFETPYSVYQSELSNRLIAEELRTFMANIQRSTGHQPPYPRYQ